MFGEIYLLKELGIKIQQTEKKKGLQITSLKKLERWDFDYLNGNQTDIFSSLENAKFPTHSIGNSFKFVTRGWSKKNYALPFTFNFASYLSDGFFASFVALLD